MNAACRRFVPQGGECKEDVTTGMIHIEGEDLPWEFTTIKNLLGTIDNGVIFCIQFPEGGVKAAKIMNVESTYTTTELQLFRTEVVKHYMAQQQLSDLSITLEAATIYKNNRNQSVGMIIMEAFPNTLFSRVNEIDLIGNAVEAIKQMHDLQVFHGDLHPGNIAIAESGGIKMFDWPTSIVQGVHEQLLINKVYVNRTSSNLDELNDDLLDLLINNWQLLDLAMFIVSLIASMRSVHGPTIDMVFARWTDLYANHRETLETWKDDIIRADFPIMTIVDLIFDDMFKFGSNLKQVCIAAYYLPRGEPPTPIVIQEGQTRENAVLAEIMDISGAGRLSRSDFHNFKKGVGFKKRRLNAYFC